METGDWFDLEKCSWEARRDLQERLRWRTWPAVHSQHRASAEAVRSVPAPVLSVRAARPVLVARSADLPHREQIKAEQRGPREPPILQTPGPLLRAPAYLDSR